ncbi:MAG: FkbM family methyltransferase [Gammaproteobacteria bacterium]|nr:FkbM family methyltransferase [Gammaproteobacteria bacterium]
MGMLSIVRHIVRHPLNRGRAPAAMGHFLRWQLASRLLAADFVLPWIGGARLLVRRGETGLTGNLYVGLEEFADMGYLLHVLRAEDFFVDIGANAGAYTVLAGAVVGARTAAFEPVPSTYQRLVDNIRINRIESKTTPRRLAIGASAGTVRFTSRFDTVNHALATGEADADSIDVAMARLDEALADAAPAVIKIDVEGAEIDVLEGAAVTLSDPRLHSVIVELNGSGRRYGHTDEAVVARLAAQGFAPHTYDPLARRLIELGDRRLTEGNTLFLRNLAVIRARIASAAPIEVFGKCL